jgi:hypothetical protein
LLPQKVVVKNLVFLVFQIRKCDGSTVPLGKVENILKGSLDSIPLPSPSAKIQIMGGKVCLRRKGKTLLGVVHKVLKTKSLLTSPSDVLPYYLK